MVLFGRRRKRAAPAPVVLIGLIAVAAPAAAPAQACGIRGASRQQSRHGDLGLVDGATVPQKKARPASAATDEKAETGSAPQVEIYIPSVSALVAAAKRSKTAEIYQGLSSLFAVPEDESGEEFDFAAVTGLVMQLGQWPDTSVALTTYTPDREGRARWAARFDWSLPELVRQVRALLESDAARKLLPDVSLEEDDGSYTIAAPDLVLAYLKKTGAGSLVASAAELKPPGKVFGQKDGGNTGRRSLVYCRLDMQAAEEGEQPPALGGVLAPIMDIRYAGSLDGAGLWRERLNVRWSPLIGAGVKTFFKKTSKFFEVPAGAYAAAAVNIGAGQFATMMMGGEQESMANSLAGLPDGTIGRGVSNEMAVVVSRGDGFLPFPDVFFQFSARGPDRIVKAIRRAMRKDARKRREDERPPAWHEEQIEGRPVFWRNPAADGSAGLNVVTYRTVLFFDEPADEAGAAPQLVVARTSNWAEDAVRRWGELKKEKKTAKIPDSPQAHWQARISWSNIYAVLQPYLVLAAGVGGPESSGLPAEADDLREALADSVIDVKIEYAGVDLRHHGPIPLGGAYVPAVTAASLGTSGSSATEAGRERLACRKLRVLYHHAKLFRKDHERWPATVAELDGYVDFATHPDLLNLAPPDRGAAVGFIRAFTGRREKPETGDEAVDDSLYEIEWSPDAWKLKFRDGEFLNYRTIYIDQEGRIHRVEKEKKT